MTGSSMGALLLTFLRPLFFALTAVFVLAALSFAPWAWGIAAAFFALALWAHFNIKRYEANCQRNSLKANDWLQSSEPALYVAIGKTKELLQDLPGYDGVSLGVAFGPSATSDYGICLRVKALWQDFENVPQSVGGMSWTEWCANIPEQVDGFRIVVELLNAPNNEEHFWTAQDGFSESTRGKR